MQTFISILRGINVSGQKKILMQDLKTLYESLQLKEVQTYIQSGNVVFRCNEKITDVKLGKKIEEAIFKKYNFHVPVIVRSSSEMKNIVSSNPFVKEKNIDEKKLHVTFLSEIPSEENVKSIENIDFSPDRFIISGKEIYLHVPESYGETKLSNQFFEKKLKVTATTRNWNTVIKLMEMSSQ
jgi:uncharacterized protein (DUF1697 family)